MAERIGITTRVTTSSHGEDRDCLARDWTSFMASMLPEILWMPLPNTGESIIEQADHWKLDGFIFSGGNDVGQFVERDLTEQALLEYAFEKNLPVFGVCRGLQYLQKHFGGELKRCCSENHVATRHTVSISNDLLEFDAQKEIIVNSYHDWGVPKAALVPELEILAISEDGCVEAARHRQAPITAVQWHPERDNPAAEFDRNMVSNILGKGR